MSGNVAGKKKNRLMLNGLRLVRRFLRFALLLFALFLSACASNVVKQTDAGNAHFEKQEYDEALTAYRQAQVAEPDLAEPYYNAANAYNRQGQVDGALAQTEQALKTAQGVLAAQAWYNLGNAYFDAQQWDQAIESYKSALRLFPTDEDAKHNLELAVQQQQAQAQQSQQQQSSENQENQQDQAQNQESQTGQSTPTPEGQENQTGQSTPTPESQNETQDSQTAEAPESEGEPTAQAGAQLQEGEMTPEQAAQLLQTLLSDSETLQEKLREIHQAPGVDPSEDW